MLFPEGEQTNSTPLAKSLLPELPVRTAAGHLAGLAATTTSTVHSLHHHNCFLLLWEARTTVVTTTSDPIFHQPSCRCRLRPFYHSSITRGRLSLTLSRPHEIFSRREQKLLFCIYGTSPSGLYSREVLRRPLLHRSPLSTVGAPRYYCY